MFYHINNSSNDDIDIKDFDIYFRETLDIKGSWIVSNELIFKENGLDVLNRSLIKTETIHVPWLSIKNVTVNESLTHSKVKIDFVDSANHLVSLNYFFGNMSILDKLCYYFELYNVGYALNRKRV
jgi:hypothetical protein